MTPVFFPPLPNPEGAGYGGSAYGLWAYGDGTLGGADRIFWGGYGQEDYGHDPYGSGRHPANPYGIDGGYGGDPYGHGPYGSIDTEAPRVASAISLDGFRIELFFSEAMGLTDPALIDPASYTIEPLGGYGAPSTPLSVEVGSVSDVDVGGGGPTVSGALSVIVTHSGTTLGGTYKITIVGPVKDISGNAVIVPPDISEGPDPFNPSVIQSNEAVFLAKGEPPTYTVTPLSGNEAVVEFSHDMLPEADFTPGVETESAYLVESNPVYPVPFTVLEATHPYDGDDSKVKLDVLGMTSITYDTTIEPADAIIYDGTYLPSDATTFYGVEIPGSVGTSTAGTFLSMSKLSADLYGWVFADTSGKLAETDSTYRMDFTFEVPAGSITPSVTPGVQFLKMAVGDGTSIAAVEAKLALSWDGGGNPIVEVALVGNWNADWTTGTHTLSVIRNKKAGFFTFLWDGTPQITTPEAAITSSASFPGFSAELQPGFDVTNFRIHSVDLTASTTVFSAAWNFLHGVGGSFTGSAALTRDHLLTDYGPLVKGWGDATPATKKDVTLYVNSTPVDVSKVNPYIGKIWPTIPIPLSPPPTAASGTIEVGPGQPTPGVATLTVNGTSITEGTHWTNGATVNDTAAAIAAALVLNCGVNASATANIIDVSALTTGFAGNTIGMVNTSGDPDFTLSGATLSGGVDGVDVTVDYIWFRNPAMKFAGLNTEGLVLNKADRRWGHTYPPSHGEAIQDLPDHPKGVVDTARFPFGLLLGPSSTRRAPVHIGHRYMGFEREYSALLNSPTTLLLNRDPHKIAVPDFQCRLEGETTSYEATVAPTAATPAWTLFGVDDGAVVPDEGTYTVIDNSAGSFEEGTTALYKRDIDVGCLSTITVAGRLIVQDFTPYGVFTGVALGAHDDRHLYMVGMLQSDNDVWHVGMLKDATQPNLIESWELGPAIAAEILSENTLRVSADQLPLGMEVGWRFEIFGDSQAGVYTVASIFEGDEFCVGRPVDGTATITIEETFPDDPNLWGNRYLDIVFETKVNERLSYRLIADPDSGAAQLYVSGDVSGYFLNLTEPPPFADPAGFPLIFDTSGTGEVFWGSTSRWATNQSNWSFLRYGVTSDGTKNAREVVVRAEMNDVPQDDPNDEWFFGQKFGYSEIDATADRLLLKNTSGSGLWDETFYYARTEPFLSPKAQIDLDAHFLVDSGTHGWGDADAYLHNTEREVLLATLLYMDPDTFNDKRRLIDLPAASVSGLYVPDRDPSGDWTAVDSLTAHVEGKTLVTSMAVGDTGGGWKATLSQPTEFTDSGDRTAEARFAVESYVPQGVNGETYIEVEADIGPSGASQRQVTLTLWETGGTPYVVLLDSTGTVVQSYAFTWNDGEFHTYRLVADYAADNLVPVFDDVVQAPVALSAFLTGGANEIFFGQTGGVARVRWDSLSMQMGPPASAKRTLGVWIGGDKSDIDQWEIPRSDSSTAPNSSATGPVVFEMDWRSLISARIHMDPTWGATIIRTDLPPPPYFDGDFATETTIPSAGWINVEYRRLPRVATPELFGRVAFGALGPQSITQQRWEWLRYRIYNYPLDDYRMPQGMVLNRYNVITSGEPASDPAPETVVVTSIDSTHVSLKPAHIYAKTIFSVVANGTSYTTDQWTFDPESQLISLGLDEDGNQITFPGDHVPVTLVFAVGKPITNTYLCSQPFRDSVTKLNEGTPPFAKSQVEDQEAQTVLSGSAINSHYNVLNSDPSFVLNDPLRVATFEPGTDTYYEALEFCEVDDGGQTGLLSSICDGPAPDRGFVAMELSGTLFSEFGEPPVAGSGGALGGGSLTPPQPHFPQGGGMPGHILHASGGNTNLGGVLGGGDVGVPPAAVMWPSYPAEGVTPGTDAGAIFRRVQWVLRLDTVIIGWRGDFPIEQALEEDLTWDPEGDNVPPTGPATQEIAPDGTPGAQGHGACHAQIEGPADYPRLGPWGGLGSLTPDADTQQGPTVGGVPIFPPFTSSSLLYGGRPLAEGGMVLQGGAPLPQPPPPWTGDVEAAN